MGFSEQAIVIGRFVLISFYNYFIHSNCRWSLGPLRYVLVSPVFHRWHHSVEPEAQRKNFAAMFSWLDLLAGTYYYPADRKPELLGVDASEGIATGFVGQLLHPFTVAGRALLGRAG